MKRTAGSGDLLKEALNGASEAFQENVAMQKEASTRYETTKIEINYDEKHVQNLQTEDWGVRLFAVCQQIGGLFLL
ncbi:hypothetical protein P7H06_22370 [Paenibacillus larvae]|nr:hypothetical protein [Paenibacillus larvae]MDT2261694.1 hypothetical protein [Paenibacillus larvae]